MEAKVKLIRDNSYDVSTGITLLHEEITDTALAGILIILQHAGITDEQLKELPKRAYSLVNIEKCPLITLDDMTRAAEELYAVLTREEPKTETITVEQLNKVKEDLTIIHTHCIELRKRNKQLEDEARTHSNACKQLPILKNSLKKYRERLDKEIATNEELVKTIKEYRTGN